MLGAGYFEIWLVHFNVCARYYWPADLNASTEGWSNKKEGKVFHYKTGIRRRGIELLESFLVLFPTKVPWNQAHNSGVSLSPGYQWPVTSCFFWYKARFCHLLSWFIFPLLLGKLVSSLFQSSIVKRTRSNYCGLSLMFLISLTDFIHHFIFFYYYHYFFFGTCIVMGNLCEL